MRMIPLRFTFSSFWRESPVKWCYHITFFFHNAAGFSFISSVLWLLIGLHDLLCTACSHSMTVIIAILQLMDDVNLLLFSYSYIQQTYSILIGREHCNQLNCTLSDNLVGFHDNGAWAKCEKCWRSVTGEVGGKHLAEIPTPRNDVFGVVRCWMNHKSNNETLIPVGNWKERVIWKFSKLHEPLL